MPGFQNEGANDSAAILVGPWGQIRAWVSSTAYYVGTAQQGVLTISNEVYRHMDTTWPRQIDAIIPVSMTMTFAAALDEVNRQNLNLVLGQAFASPGEYTYFGNLVTPTYFGLQGTRRRTSDGQFLEFYLYKALAFGEVTLGDADEAVPVPFAAEGMSDPDGTYGSSAAGRVAWMRVPSGP